MENRLHRSLIRTGEVELSEFFPRSHAWEERDWEIVCSDVRALARGIRSALMAVTPLWLGLALWLLR